jgi:hypothetical protein
MRIENAHIVSHSSIIQGPNHVDLPLVNITGVGMDREHSIR